MFTLIGSQAIRMLSLKNSYTAYRRSTDAKIELLKEVIERIKNGENVDVEKLLGTGDDGKEREWEDGTSIKSEANGDLMSNLYFSPLVLREIEQEDTLWQQKHSKETKKTSTEPEKQPTHSSQGKESTVPAAGSADEETMKKTQSTRKVNFF